MTAPDCCALVSGAEIATLYCCALVSGAEIATLYCCALVPGAVGATCMRRSPHEPVPVHQAIGPMHFTNLWVDSQLDWNFSIELPET
ncbi:MAG: hypothetical protein EBE86_002755 [Hormoscilla sp. GUM202]|nr:hypothetical protein [Hormoscilla sp. GUM202]